MKLNEINSELIDEMLEKYPIRGILTIKTLQKVESFKDEVCFHSKLGWFHFSKTDLKETKRFFHEECLNDVIEIKQTENGFIYCFLDANSLIFFKKNGRQNALKPLGIMMNFSDSVNKSDRHGFLLSKGVECMVRRFVIPYNSQGEMMIGQWHNEYISVKN